MALNGQQEYFLGEGERTTDATDEEATERGGGPGSTGGEGPSGGPGADTAESSSSDDAKENEDMGDGRVERRKPVVNECRIDC